VFDEVDLADVAGDLADDLEDVVACAVSSGYGLVEALEWVGGGHGREGNTVGQLEVDNANFSRHNRGMTKAATSRSRITRWTTAAVIAGLVPLAGLAVANAQPEPAPAPAIQVVHATEGRAAAARELLAHVESGGRVEEDLSFAGMSPNMAAYNDEIADLFYEGDIQWPEDQAKLAPFLRAMLA